MLATDVVLPEHLPREIRHGGLRAATLSVVPSRSHDEEQEQLRLEVELAAEAAEIDLKAFGAEAADRAERSLLQALLRRPRMTGGNMARRLGVDPKTLRAKLRRHGLEARLAATG